MSDTEQIKNKIDIVEFIGEYVQLKKAGSNWKGLCPFHNEKSPSFMVNPERQIFHCFGCAKGGDVFSFLQEIEGLDFAESLKILADRAGVQLTNYKPEIDKSKKNRLYDVNLAGTNFYNQFLLEIESAKPALDYLKKRGLTLDTIKDFKVGYIPEQWDLLTKYLIKKGHGVEDLVEAGLTIKKQDSNFSAGRGYYDRFRGRIMFPIWDIHDNIVGFTGRQLVENKDVGGKYVNTPETLVFDKSRVIYGLNKARMEIRSKDLAVVVEGQMDVISSHQAGIKNVVASSGTALTEDQIKMIKRYTGNIAFAFDADEAGEKAAKRGIDMAVSAGMNVSIIQIPKEVGKDADDIIQKDPKIWEDLTKKGIEVMKWHFDRLLPRYDFDNPKEKQRLIDEMLVEISKIPYLVEKTEWLKRLSEKTDTDIVVLKSELTRSKTGIKITPQNNTEAEEPKKPKDRFEQDLENFWALIVKYPESFEMIKDVILEDIFKNSSFHTLYEIFKKEYTNINQLEVLYEEKGQDDLVDILVLKADTDYDGYGDDKAKKEIGKMYQSLKEEWVKKEQQVLLRSLRQAEAENDQEKLSILLNNLNNLNKV